MNNEIIKKTAVIQMKFYNYIKEKSKNNLAGIVFIIAVINAIASLVSWAFYLGNITVQHDSLFSTVYHYIFNYYSFYACISIVLCIFVFKLRSIIKELLKRNNSSGLHIIEQTYQLKFVKADGSLAKYTKTQEFYPLVDNIERFCDRAETFEGDNAIIKSYKISQGNSGPDLTKTFEPDPMSKGSFFHTLIQPLEKYTKYVKTLEFEFSNNFMEDHEYYSLYIRLPIDTLIVRIFFLQERRFKPETIKILVENDNITSRLDIDPEIVESNDHIYAEFRIDKPSVATKYRVEWDW